MTPWAGPAHAPPQPRENPSAPTAAIFNAVAIGVAGLYAATGSLWLTCAAGGVAASLAALHLVTDRSRPAGTQATPEQHDPAGALPQIEPAGTGGRGEVPLMDDPENRKRFEDFFREEYSKVVHGIMRLGAGLAEAEDVASDAMCRTLTRWTGIADPAAYAHTCARHAYFAKLRQKAGEAPLGDRPASEETSPDLLDLLDLKDQERRVHEVLARLPRTQRTVMHLHYAGLSTEEIARELRTQEATVRSNLRHARQRLRTLLSDEGLI